MKFLGQKKLSLVFSVAMIIALGLVLNSPTFSQQLKQTFDAVAQNGGEHMRVDATKKVAPFADDMRGVALVNWEHSWNRPFIGQVPGVTEAMKAIRPGVIRYAGGLWSNSVGFERTAQRTPYEQWSKDGNTYLFHYGTNELEDLNTFADAVGADVMMQVNIGKNDPKMWADAVTYANVDNRFGFRYWELGNEFDLEKMRGESDVSPEEYVRRMQDYGRAMYAADDSIELMGAAAAFTVKQDDADSSLSPFLTLLPQGARDAGTELGALSWHWYQDCNAQTYDQILKYKLDNSVPDTSWRNAYVRRWSRLLPTRIQSDILGNYPEVKQAVTEMNVDACNYENPMNGNHIGALWFADQLGALAYHGVDMATTFTGYGSQAYSLLYPDNNDRPTRIDARPTYYTYLMYANYFGDTLVESSAPHDDMSIWASVDSKDNNKLKLMVVNLSSSERTTPIYLAGHSTESASAYTMTSTNPTDMSATSKDASHTTSINGTRVDAMRVQESLARIQPRTAEVRDSQINYSFPAYSVTAVIVNGSTSESADTNDLRSEFTDEPVQQLPVLEQDSTQEGVSSVQVQKPVIDAVTHVVSKSQYIKGEEIEVTTSVRTNKDIEGLVNIELYNDQNQKVMQQFVDNQRIIAQRDAVITLTFSGTEVLPAGSYSLKLGVFSQGWEELYYWNDKLETIMLTETNAQKIEGTGLTADYFRDMTLSSPAAQRIDKTVNFNWKNNSPVSDLYDQFSARWKGYVTVPESDTYTFYTTSDDGVRMWVNYHQIISAWNDHPAQEDSGSLYLEKGKRYPIQLEYYERWGQAQMSLEWSTSSVPKHIVPTEHLFAQ